MDTVHFTGTTPDFTTRYFFGGAYETRSDGATLKYYSFAGQMVAMRDGEGLKYLLSDHLGSMVAITDDVGTLITVVSPKVDIEP